MLQCLNLWDLVVVHILPEVLELGAGLLLQCNCVTHKTATKSGVSRCKAWQNKQGAAIAAAAAAGIVPAHTPVTACGGDTASKQAFTEHI